MTEDRDNFDSDLRAEIVARPRSRDELEAEFGQVWDAEQLAYDFITTAIIPPTYIVRRRSDGAVGSVLCQPRAKLFINFRPSPDPA